MRCTAFLIGLALAASAAAQTGTLDQVSPTPSGSSSANFNVGTSFLIWQAQIKAGVAGQLEGIKITLTGNAGALTNVRVRKGAAPTSNAALFDAPVIKQTSSNEIVFVNMTAANITLAAGEVFVMETQGNDTGCGLNGSYIAPPGTPLYPEPLFLNGSNFADGGWRHGFETYMLGGACYPDCNGDSALTIADFACFQSKFVAADPYADCNGDSAFTIADFACFQSKFVAGCP